MMRMIFSTVRAPHEPGLDRRVVRHQRDRAAGDRGRAGDDAVGGQAVGQDVREGAVLGEAAVVDEQGDPVPGEQLPGRRGGLVVPGRAALLDLVPEPGQLGVTGLAVEARVLQFFASRYATVLARPPSVAAGLLQPRACDRTNHRGDGNHQHDRPPMQGDPETDSSDPAISPQQNREMASPFRACADPIPSDVDPMPSDSRTASVSTFLRIGAVSNMQERATHHGGRRRVRPVLSGFAGRPGAPERAAGAR